MEIHDHLQARHASRLPALRDKPSVRADAEYSRAVQIEYLSWLRHTKRRGADEGYLEKLTLSLEVERVSVMRPHRARATCRRDDCTRRRSLIVRRQCRQIDISLARAIRGVGEYRRSRREHWRLFCERTRDQPPDLAPPR